jgi:DNA-binding MarR family transcriptional regulator
MPDTGAMEQIREFLGSARIFTKAVNTVLEEKLLAEILGSQITLSQMQLLELVAFTDARTITEIAAYLNISNAAASKAVDKLVRRKLLARTGGALDRRAIEVSLTEFGSAQLKAFDNARTERLQKLFCDFPPDEMRAAATLLDRISATVVSLTAKPEELCLQCGIHFRERCLVRQLLRCSCSYQQQKTRRQRLVAAPPTVKEEA